MGLIENQPLLGLATTRQLLEEIEARAEMHISNLNYTVLMIEMRVDAKKLLRDLPDSILNYRTVDSG